MDICIASVVFVFVIIIYSIVAATVADAVCCRLLIFIKKRFRYFVLCNIWYYLARENVRQTDKNWFICVRVCMMYVMYSQTSNNTFLISSHAPCTLCFLFTTAFTCPVFDFMYWFLFSCCFHIIIIFFFSSFVCVYNVHERMNEWMNMSFGMSAPV